MTSSHPDGLQLRACRYQGTRPAGPLTLDCDVLTAAASDLRIVAYTAPPGSDAADKLKLLAVIGTQTMA